MKRDHMSPLPSNSSRSGGRAAKSPAPTTRAKPRANTATARSTGKATASGHLPGKLTAATATAAKATAAKSAVAKTAAPKTAAPKTAATKTAATKAAVTTKTTATAVKSTGRAGAAKGTGTAASKNVVGAKRAVEKKAPTRATVKQLVVEKTVVETAVVEKAQTAKAATPKAATPKAATPKGTTSKGTANKADSKKEATPGARAKRPAGARRATSSEPTLSAGLSGSNLPVVDLPGGSVEDAIPSFAELGVPADIVQALHERGIARPFPVQVMTIPDGLLGRDVCGQAKTGSGKTLAFGIPLVALVAKAQPHHPTALVLVPTRELAAQVERELVWLAAATAHRVVSVYGGASMDQQKRALKEGAEIVVATPGRLIDLMGRGDIKLSDVRFLVLDEADRMCDMGFMPNVEWLLRHMPKDRQTLLFSATLGSDVNSLVKHELRDPVRHNLASDSTTVAESHHRFLYVHEMDKTKVVAAIVRPADRALVFVNTKRGCDRLVDELKELGIQARAIHGDLDQTRRNRALKQFGDGLISVLVATDVAARGLHIDGVDVVVQFDPPDDHKTYLHRSGRTARAGATGVVASLVLWNQMKDVIRLQKRLDLEGPIPEVFSNSPRLLNLAAWDPAVEATTAETTTAETTTAETTTASRA
jgi:superfamily II DNA/RNA helicase